MNDFTNTSDSEDSLDISARDWCRVMNAAEKFGYREGIDNGSTDVFQEGFDKGYEEGFKTAFMLGKFKSLLITMPQTDKHPQDINRILDKTKKGICHICATESENTNENMQKTFSQIVNEQKTYSAKLIQTLYQCFKPYTKELNIDESDILDISNAIKKTFEDN